MQETTKLINVTWKRIMSICNIENVVTTNLNHIHIFNIRNCQNGVQKRPSYVIFVKSCRIAFQMKFSIFITSHIKLR
jgi:hypothetical protein